MKKKMLFLVVMLFIICSFNLLAKKSSGDIKLPDSTYKLLEEFSQKKKDAMEKLKTLSEKEAVKFYSEYSYEIEEFAHQKIEENLKKSLNNVSSTKYNNVNKILSRYDLKIVPYFDLPFYIELSPTYYYDMFKDYVTDAHREYLRIEAKYSKAPSAEYTDDPDDFFLLISPQKLGDRIVECEDFLKKYSDNKDYDYRIDLGYYLYNRYIDEYIFRVNNMYIEDNELRLSIYDNDGVFNISKEMSKEYDRFMKKYPDSKVTEFLKFFIKNCKDKNKHSLIYKKFKDISISY